MNTPAVSVAMSVYNGERFLAEAIGSVLAQTFTDFEFLILDDGSRDGTQAIIADYASRDARIRPILRENRGLVASLNQLLAELQTILGTNLTPIYQEMRAGDVRHSQADISYTEKMIGYKPIVSLAEGLRRTVEWYQQNQ